MGRAWTGHRRPPAGARGTLTRYLLDTNIISDIVRNPGGRVVETLAFTADDETMTSVIVAGELSVWAARSGSPRLQRLIATTLVAIPPLPLNIEVADIYGELRASLEKSGTTIGANDLWIAAHALALNAIVVTDNTREFSRVPNLTIQNWLRP